MQNALCDPKYPAYIKENRIVSLYTYYFHVINLGIRVFIFCVNIICRWQPLTKARARSRNLLSCANESSQKIKKNNNRACRSIA